MTAPASLSPSTDPTSLAKLQVLLVPVQNPNQPLTDSTYTHWSTLIRRHTSLRSDELRQPFPSASGGGADPSHNRGAFGADNRLRFFPPSGSTSISKGGATTGGHVHLSYPAAPPAKHLYPLSLLRLTMFPLIVIGIAVDPGKCDAAGLGGLKGYSLGSDEESGDLGEASTPTLASFAQMTPRGSNSTPAQMFEDALADLFPPTSPFPLVKRLVLVPAAVRRASSPMPSPSKASWDQEMPRLGKGKERAEGDVRWAPMDAQEGWVSRLLGEAVGDLLGELGELATALETPQGLRTLSSTLLPSLTATAPLPTPGSRTDSPGSLGHASRSSITTPTSSSVSHAKAIDHLSQSSGMGISLSRALTPGGRPTSVQAPSHTPIPSLSAPPAQSPPAVSASSNPFRRSTALTSPFSRTPSAGSNTTPSPSPLSGPAISMKYTAASLNGIAGGRLMKLLGDMYLLVGLYSDAIKCFDDGAERARLVGDVLWEAMAREGRAVAGVAEAWETRDGSELSQPFSNAPIPVEILAHYLSALSCLSRAPLPFPPTILSPSPQALAGSLTLPMGPAGLSPVLTGTGEGLLAYLYTGLSLRISHFLLLIWTTGGWGSLALSALMTHTLPRNFPPALDGAAEKDEHSRRRRKRYLAQLCSKSGITRNSIFSHTLSALGPPHRAMTKPEQVALHVEAIWLCRWLDLPRREAAVTRDVLSRLTGLILEGREESRRALTAAKHASRSSLDGPMVGLGVGLKPDPMGDGTGPDGKKSAMAVRRKESTEGNEGLMALLVRAASILGVELMPLLAAQPAITLNSEAAGTSSGNPPSVDPDIRGPRFGWPELQVSLMQLGIHLAESLPDHPSTARLALSTLSKLHVYLNPQSQAHLSRTWTNALSVIKRRGAEWKGIGWWIPGRMVLSLEIASLSLNRMPVEHSAAEIAPTGKMDPFLYNPRLKASEAGKTILVANEQIDAFVTLQNPFAFDLELADLGLITAGTEFVSSPLPIVLPANSIQTIRVTGNCPSPGTLHLKGVRVRLPDGAHTEVPLPIMDDKAKSRTDKRRSRLASDLARTKRIGAEARFAADEVSKRDRDSLIVPPGQAPPQPKLPKAEEASGEGDRWLECRVVEEMPLLWIKKTSLTHGTVMLYNGERSTLRITLENSSPVPVDFIKLSFDDSTVREAQAIFAEGEIPPEQAYELDHDLKERPVFRWDEGESEGGWTGLVPPGGRTTLTISVLGKVGCTDGSIRINYGYVHRPEAPGSFHTRQITFPVLFTVYHTLEPHNLDVLRFGGSNANSSTVRPTRSESPMAAESEDTGTQTRTTTSSRGARSQGTVVRSGSYALPAEDDLRVRMEQESGDGWCLLSLGIRNVYGVPFEVTLHRADTDEHEGLSASRLITPGATERLLIPFPRLSIPSSLLEEPIPSLSERQYVVDKRKKSEEIIRREKELFWFREEMLKLASATWREVSHSSLSVGALLSPLRPGSLREGTLSLRNQALRPDMLDVLRDEQVQVTVNVVPRSGQSESSQVEMMDFVDVRVQVINRLERSFRPFVRLEPVSSTSWASALPARRSEGQPAAGTDTAAKHIAFDGLLARTLSLLQPGETATHDVGAVFTAQGQFAFRAAVEDVTEGEQDRRVRFSDVATVHVA